MAASCCAARSPFLRSLMSSEHVDAADQRAGRIEQRSRMRGMNGNAHAVGPLGDRFHVSDRRRS